MESNAENPDPLLPFYSPEFLLLLAQVAEARSFDAAITCPRAPVKSLESCLRSAMLSASPGGQAA